ncbi:MAG: LytTR family DNA-binding domain-containing protein [Prolixibacteraceae bacterium]|jgi:two-component system LytT family response regulator|nr:LytTR family DNA-binding domain-containing protein [Prolixibacteraceae bacterium]
MYHTVIIDDDILARRVLKRILEQNFKEIEIAGEADSVTSGIELIENVEPDLVFLDIEMPDGTGFSLIEQLENVNFKLVFTTSYSDYAITAFKYSAFDYIVKPVLLENVKSTIKRINDIPVLHEKQRVEILKNNLTRREPDREATIALPEMNGFSIVKVKDIVRCEGERNYSRIFFREGKSVLVSRTLLEFDNLLVPHGFYRIHRSHLINLKDVTKFMKTDGGIVEMSDKSQLRVSPKFKDELLNLLLNSKL